MRGTFRQASHQSHTAISPRLHHASSRKGASQRTCCPLPPIDYDQSVNPLQAAQRASNLLRTIQFTHPPSCPCHSNPSHHHHKSPASFFQRSVDANRRYATPADGPLSKDYAFEMAASSIRFGPGVTQEVGKDLKNLKSKKVVVVTDPTVDNLFPMQQVRESLAGEGVEYTVYNQVTIEPKDTSYVLHLP